MGLGLPAPVANPAPAAPAAGGGGGGGIGLGLGMPPAPAAGAGGFNLGGFGAPAAGGGAGGGGPPVVPNAQDDDKELQGKQIKQIIRDWKEELQKHLERFHRQSGIVRAWEQQLHFNNMMFTKVGGEIERLSRAQNELDTFLHKIEGYQVSSFIHAPFFAVAVRQALPTIFLSSSLLVSSLLFSNSPLALTPRPATLHTRADYSRGHDERNRKEVPGAEHAVSDTIGPHV